jgi:uncharacterized membrane protein
MVTIDNKATKWLALALLVSLSVNLLLGGLIAGWHLRDPGPRHPNASLERPIERPVQALLERMTARLEPDERRVFHATLQAHRADLQAAREEVKIARQKLRRILNADLFDREAMDAAFADVRARTNAFQAVLQGAIADAAESLSPEARRRLAD